LRRILVRIQGASASAYLWICAGGCNVVDGPKDKQGCVFIFYRGPYIQIGPLFSSFQTHPFQKNRENQKNVDGQNRQHLVRNGIGGRAFGLGTP
jgi:hypothetical protein